MTFWNDERTENLKTKWARGDSAGTIADAFGTTRNAVIGKAHRMGLAERATYQRKPTPKRVRTYVERPRIATVKRISLVPLTAEPLPPPHVTDIPRVSFDDINFDKDCSWPCAEHTNNAAPLYCGCKKLEGLPYCENHARRAYVGAPDPRLRLYRKTGSGLHNKQWDRNKLLMVTTRINPLTLEEA